MQTHRLLLPVAIAALLSLACVARPQSGSSAAAERDCAEAAKAVDHGHSAKKLDPALNTLRDCPTQLAELYVSTFADLRTSRDTAELGRWSWRSADLRDGTVFSAARDLARSALASAEARTFALITMQLLVTPRSYTPFESIAAATAAGATNRCSIRHLGHNEQMIGTTPMPADAAAQFRATVSALMTDPLTPPLVRNRAGCM